jgi:hypothetical protein
MYVDPSGESAILAIIGTLLIGSLIGGLAGGIAAEVTGQSFRAGFAGGAVSGLISTFGMALAVTTGGLGGLAIAGGFGFASGFSGSITTQFINKKGSNLSLNEWNHALVSGGISSVVNIFSFGILNFAMRNTVGIFDDIFDKGLGFGTRLVNSLMISGPALTATCLFSAPMTTVNSLIDILRSYNSKGKIDMYHTIYIDYSYYVR